MINIAPGSAYYAPSEIHFPMHKAHLRSDFIAGLLCVVAK